MRLPFFVYKFFPQMYVKHLREVGVKIGANTAFFGAVLIDETHPNFVEIGSNCVFTDGVKVLVHGWVHPILAHKYGIISESVLAPRKVSVGNFVYFGTNTIVLPGVTIGDNVIVGAGSIVTHSIPSDCVAAGNPCRVLCSLDEYYEKLKARAGEGVCSWDDDNYMKEGESKSEA